MGQSELFGDLVDSDRGHQSQSRQSLDQGWLLGLELRQALERRVFGNTGHA
jgi:hypothetical protein